VQQVGQPKFINQDSFHLVLSWLLLSWEHLELVYLDEIQSLTSAHTHNLNEYKDQIGMKEKQNENWQKLNQTTEEHKAFIPVQITP